MFGIGPAYMFFIRHRLPYGFRQGGVKYWFSTVSFNLVTCLFLISFISTIGLMPFLLVHALVILIAASIGVWLFYIQHQFEYVTWTNNDKWEFETAAIYGSSYYRLPPFLMWLTANIGIHHVHHLNSRIPFYRLSEALADHHELKTINEIPKLIVKEDFPNDIEIRGEVFIANKDFEKIKENFANPRNAASGSLLSLIHI